MSSTMKGVIELIISKADPTPQTFYCFTSDGSVYRTLYSGNKYQVLLDHSKKEDPDYEFEKLEEFAEQSLMTLLESSEGSKVAKDFSSEEIVSQMLLDYFDSEKGEEENICLDRFYFTRMVPYRT